jgi:hypothetical protein
MWTVERFSMKEPSIAWARLLVVTLAFGAVSLGCVRAQPAQPAPAKGSGSPENSSGGPAFSIETEMLTYRALESNSEAVACDIAAYLNGATANFVNPPAGTVCDVKAGTKKASVVLLPFDSSEFTNFEIWRADMATMERLQSRAAQVDCTTKRVSNSKGASGATNAAISASPAGPPLAVAQGVLAMLASERSTSSVTGTIHDQAFMDGVGRDLQELSVPVLMPTAYAPHSLESLDESNSPFLASLNRTLTARGCLEGLAATDAAKNRESDQTTRDARAYIVKRTISDIDAFLSTLTESAASAPQGKKTDRAKPESESSPAQNLDGAESPVVPAPAPSSSHLSAVLMADGLAAKLGVDPDTGALSPDDAASLHILMVKALESGGSVSRFSNALGTRISFSGGSVGTYALFSLDGGLECSGNVYEYGGSLKSKDFQRELRGYTPEPGKQVVFLRHSCSPLAHTQ